MSENCGLYIAVNYNSYSTKKIIEIAENFQVPNIIPLDKFHTTLIYSTKGAENVEVYGDIEYVVLPNALDIWTSKSGEKCLVLKFDCKRLVDRNKELMSKYGFVSDYPEYIPHITISYDIGNWNRIVEMQYYLNSNRIYNMLLTTGEYMEDLQTEWSNTL